MTTDNKKPVENLTVNDLKNVELIICIYFKIKDNEPIRFTYSRNNGKWKLIKGLYDDPESLGWIYSDNQIVSMFKSFYQSGFYNIIEDEKKLVISNQKSTER